MESPRLAGLSCPQKADEVGKVLQGLVVDADKAREVKRVFEQELRRGLAGGSCLQMENTRVTELTDGKERGSFLALDLGGTNFRVVLLRMLDGRIVEEVVKYYVVAEATRLGPGEQLFDFLADCVGDFMAEQCLMEGVTPLGFTFSFPMTQKGLDGGILVSWTKSFNCPDVVGKDAAQMLRDAFARRNNDRVKVVAILNDATGTLVKGAYDDPDTCIGLILGTGCNGAYLENVKIGDGTRRESDRVVIDPEFGAFGDDGCVDFLKTEFDVAVDRDSLLPGSFTYEKYFAGKYVGEVARAVLRKLHRRRLIFDGMSCDWNDVVIAAQHVSVLVKDAIAEREDGTREFVGKLIGDATKATTDDVLILQTVCRLLGDRCALLVAIPLAVFLERIDRSAGETSAIAVTGSLYQHHPTIKDSLEKYVRMFSENKSFVYTFCSEDGSGKGAGLVAAIAARMGEK